MVASAARSLLCHKRCNGLHSRKIQGGLRAKYKGDRTAPSPTSIGPCRSRRLQSIRTGLATNSPRAHYAISGTALDAVKTFGTSEWESAVANFLSRRTALIEVFERRRSKRLIPVRFPDGKLVRLSPGAHNKLQRAVVEQFASRFVENPQLLYLGDTAKKNLFIQATVLKALGFPITEHDKLPDVIIYDKKRNWLFLVEAVTSHGPMSKKRVLELELILAGSTAGLIYVSAFPDMTEFRRHTNEIAWDTEVWIAEIPEHLIHYNGDRFFGPRERSRG
jgi:type II restriction enzyme